MKKVIKIGKGKTKTYKKAEQLYVKKCWNCKSVFTYQNEDIGVHLGMSAPDIWRDVICPVCNYKNDITIKRRYRGDKKSNGLLSKTDSTVHK